MKTWNLLKTTYKVGDLISWYREGSLNLNPNFQRNPVWKIGAKSYFIDTIIKGFPVPIIFLRDKKPNLKKYSTIRDVVDGQQRIRTLLSFIAPELLGDDLDPSRDVFTVMEVHNSDHHDLTYHELPQKIREQILDYQFSVNVFPIDTDDRDVVQVFTRMNSTGYKLNPQELRNAEFYGEFKTLAYRLANEQLNRWRDWHIFSADQLARMNEVEMTSEIMVFMIDGTLEKTVSHIDHVYATFEDDFKGKRQVAARFRHVFETIADNLGDSVPTLFKKRTVFFALFLGLYELQYGDADLFPTNPKHIPLSRFKRIKAAASRIVDGKAPSRVMDATTRRTTHARERRSLINFLLK